MIEPLDVLHSIEGIALLYTVLYLLANLVLILVGSRPTLDQVRERSFLDLDQFHENSAESPPIAILVPAYDEETTLVESVRSLMAIDYPNLELVIANDGSNDSTREIMCRAFGMRRRDIPVRGDLETADIRAIYEATVDLPSHVKRFVMVDKENGGRADALNAALRACLSPYFLTVDADCIVDPDSLKHLVRILQRDPDIDVVGGQVGVVNDCTVQDGRVTEARVARGFTPLCQTLEYMRAFSIMRSGFARLQSLIIISGAFMLMRREIAIEVGGFLTGRSQSRVLAEHVGAGRKTICEDMEMILRIHRRLRERGKRAKVVHAPVPLVWTEVPPDLDMLSKQRRRWHRGLLEILWMHRRMILDPRYGRIGLFSLPYFFWFEAMGPWFEAMGLLLLPILAITGWLDPVGALLITGIALGAGVLQSLAAVLISTWMEPTGLGARNMASLLGADRWIDRLRLLAGAVLTESGYRQLTVVWRIRATFEWMKGYDGWDKFERKGFETASATVLAALLGAGCLLFPTPAHGATADPREATVVVGAENRGGETASWWTEATAVFRSDDRSSWWIGSTHAERGDLRDTGLVVGGSLPKYDWGGAGLEIRTVPDAQFSARFSLNAETEFSVRNPWTGSVGLRHGFYPDADITTLKAGTVVYLPREWWWNVHVLGTRTAFDSDDVEWIRGWSTRLNVREGPVQVRLTASQGGENFWISESRGAGTIRATVVGIGVAYDLPGLATILFGVDHRDPDRGERNVYLHAGFQRGF